MTLSESPGSAVDPSLPVVTKTMPPGLTAALVQIPPPRAVGGTVQ